MKVKVISSRRLFSDVFVVEVGDTQRCSAGKQRVDQVDQIGQYQR
jgi:hypothetical protein